MLGSSLPSGTVSRITLFLCEVVSEDVLLPVVADPVVLARVVSLVLAPVVVPVDAPVVPVVVPVVSAVPVVVPVVPVVPVVVPVVVLVPVVVFVVPVVVTALGPRALSQFFLVLSSR